MPCECSSHRCRKECVGASGNAGWGGLSGFVVACHHGRWVVVVKRIAFSGVAGCRAGCGCSAAVAAARASQDRACRPQPGVVQGAVWMSGWGGGGAGCVVPLAWSEPGWPWRWGAVRAAGPAAEPGSSRARLGAGSGPLGGGWAWLGGALPGCAVFAGSSAGAESPVAGASSLVAVVMATPLCSLSLGGGCAAVVAQGVAVAVGGGGLGCRRESGRVGRSRLAVLDGGLRAGVERAVVGVGAGSVYPSLVASLGLAGE